MRIYIEEILGVLDRLNLEDIKNLIRAIKKSDAIWVIGNGGSMSVATHFAEDLVKLVGKRAIAVADMSLLSMVANDEGVGEMFLYPLRRLTGPRDLIIAFSTSGKSVNILKVLNDKVLRCDKFLVTGLGGKEVSVDKIVIPCLDVQVIEDIFTTVIHLVCRFYRGVN